ncbi:NIPSNAP family protein [Rhodococcus sp. 5A-K4]|uniref:NIPSNAP family protein n=1 Tax=Rhodococcus TaxID=1827 RepID=UPI00355C3DEF
MITCVIEYDIDPFQIQEFTRYAQAWPTIIERCGGDLTGYYVPHEGATTHGLALINFPSLAAYEQYRQALRQDPDAQKNIEFSRQTRCIRKECRSFLRRV